MAMPLETLMMAKPLGSCLLSGPMHSSSFIGLSYETYELCLNVSLNREGLSTEIGMRNLPEPR